MKELDDDESNDSPKKQKGRTKKYKQSSKLFAKNCWPKVMVSRDTFTHRKSKDPSGITPLSFPEESSNKFGTKEEDPDVEHLCCDENAENFEEEQSLCLISSSSEISCESSGRNEKNSQKLDESNEESGFDCSTGEGAISMISESQEKPIFVDLTTDEKNIWKQTILKRFSDGKTTDNERENGNQDCCTNVVLEPRIMIADSSSKVNYNGSGSLATALRDRGPCLIPVQPNRSLPIRPAPSVPTRTFRKDSSTLLILSKSSTTDVVEVEPVKSIHLNEANKEGDFNAEEERVISKESDNSMDYVIPQISSVGSLSGIKRKSDMETKLEGDKSKESRKRKRSQEADSSQREERLEGSIKDFLKNFCGSNSNGEKQNTCTDKCTRIVSSSKEEGNKLVPPLRLKKVTRTAETEGSNCETTKGAEYETNYRIITGTTPQPRSSPVSSSWNDLLCEKDSDLDSLNSDSYKLKYRRNRLKQKLRELHSKALNLAKQMTNDSNSQQSTRSRQVMNRYEKQIENLSKLHSKLSASLPISNEVIDVNDDPDSPPVEEYFLVNLNETNEEPLKNSSSASSPEPPKLSPRSPVNYESMLSEEVRNSPPILPRVCLTISSNQDEELQVSERKTWLMNEEPIKSTLPVDSLQDKASSDFEECVRTTPLRRQSNANIESERSLSCLKKVNQFPESNHVSQEKKDERDRLIEGFPYSHLAVQEPKKIKCMELSDLGPVISSVTGGSELTTSISNNEMFESTRQHSSAGERISQPNSESEREDDSFAKVGESSRTVPKVTLNHPIQFNTAGTTLSQEHFMLQQNYKGEGASNASSQRSSDNHSITEQFPTLGNWLARMSKKQVSKSKSKLQSVGNIPLTSTENSTRIPGSKVQKMVDPNTANSVMNTTPRCSTEKWQYHQQQQQQQQQLLQHVAASVTLSQSVPTVPPLRPSICPSIPMTQFYPNNYAIDPYNSAALSYHSPICPYGNYPYHSRVHSGSLSGYHFPMQETLRPLQHMEKRFPSIQDPMVRYPSPSTSSLQHSSNIDFDRIRENVTSNNLGKATCLPSLFLSPPSLSSSHQTLPRTPLAGYPTNGQFTRNRMIPDVVAAAAAAAVVAAASFDRQRDTLTYNRADTDALSTASISNVIDGDPSHVAGPNKTVIDRDMTNQIQHANFSEGHENNTKYQQMQNFLFDRLALVKTADNFAQTSTVIGNDTQARMTSIVSTTPYRMPLTSTHAQLPKNMLGNEFRNCDTPHLGKVNRSPNSLHNLICSNCGSIGPKFKCLGCEMAFYCDERCQEKHWYVHVQRCPKKMPKLKKVT